MTRRELEARLLELENRERARTAAARAKRLENRKSEREKLGRQIRNIATDEDGARRTHDAIVEQLRAYGWKTCRRTVSALLAPSV